MGLDTRSRRPPIDAPIRWSLRKAATEHGVAENTIKTGLKKHGISPGPDERYSSQQIAKALFDPDRLDAATKEAKAQKAIAEAQKAQMEMLELRGVLVRTTTLDEWLVELFTQLTQCIRHLPHLSREHRDAVLKVLGEHKFDTTKPARNGSEPAKVRSHEAGPNDKLVPFNANRSSKRSGL
jgi:hypothetical protein